MDLLCFMSCRRRWTTNLSSSVKHQRRIKEINLWNFNYKIISRLWKAKLRILSAFRTQKTNRWNGLKSWQVKQTSLSFFISKIELHFFTFHNTNIKHNKCETKSNRNQCNIIDHSIERPEQFHDQPYERIEVSQLLNFENNH